MNASYHSLFHICIFVYVYCDFLLAKAMSPTLLATKDGPRTFGFVQDGDMILCFVFEGKPSTCSRNPT